MFVQFSLINLKGDVERALDENMVILMEKMFHFMEENESSQFTLTE